MPWSDQRAGNSMCISYDGEGGTSLCGSHTCNYQIEDHNDGTLWHIIRDGRIHGICQEPLAEALGFENWSELHDHATHVVQTGRHQRPRGMR